MKNVISSTEKNKKGAGKAETPCREEYVSINGISEYLLHYPAAPEAPVFLHIHGGPGAPASIFAYRVEALPRNYTIVYYDQRGAGRTLRKNPFAGLSMALLQQDLLETVLYLKRTYNKGKIGLLGHSWSTFPAASAAGRCIAFGRTRRGHTAFCGKLSCKAAIQRSKGHSGVWAGTRRIGAA